MSPGSLCGLSGAWEARGGPTFLSLFRLTSCQSFPQDSPAVRPRPRRPNPDSRLLSPMHVTFARHSSPPPPPSAHPHPADSSIYYNFHWFISATLLDQRQGGQSNVRPRGLSSTASGEPKPLKSGPGSEASWVSPSGRSPAFRCRHPGPQQPPETPGSRSHPRPSSATPKCPTHRNCLQTCWDNLIYIHR